MKKYVVSVSGIKSNWDFKTTSINVNNQLDVTRIDSDIEEDAKKVAIEDFEKKHTEHKVTACAVMEI